VYLSALSLCWGTFPHSIHVISPLPPSHKEHLAASHSERREKGERRGERRRRENGGGERRRRERGEMWSRESDRHGEGWGSLPAPDKERERERKGWGGRKGFQSIDQEEENGEKKNEEKRNRRRYFKRGRFLKTKCEFCEMSKRSTCVYFVAAAMMTWSPLSTTHHTSWGRREGEGEERREEQRWEMEWLKRERRQ
jgi:hypothetical protein